MPLIGTLTSGVSALKTFTKDLEVIGNNIANVNTTSFKSSKSSFADDFSNTLRASSSGGVQAMQVGTGVKLSGINTNFSQGALATTGLTTDLGISGSGFFRVVNTTDSSEYATRVGSFHFDDSNFLVNSKGMRVQGFGADAAGVLDTTVGAIQLRPAADLAGKVRQSVAIGRDGVVTETYTDGTTAKAGQILIQDFAQTSALMAAGDGLYSALAFASPTNGTVALDATGKNNPGTNGLGTIEAGTLELSNVDLTEQFSNMITAQRSFQASSRLVTVADTVLEEIVNLKR